MVTILSPLWRFSIIRLSLDGPAIRQPDQHRLRCNVSPLSIRHLLLMSKENIIVLAVRERIVIISLRFIVVFIIIIIFFFFFFFARTYTLPAPFLLPCLSLFRRRLTHHISYDTEKLVGAKTVGERDDRSQIVKLGIPGSLIFLGFRSPR